MELDLSWEEIKKKFPDEWVMLVDYKWDDHQSDPTKARVAVHSKDRKEFGKLMKQTNYESSAVLYTGMASAKNLRLWKFQPYP